MKRYRSILVCVTKQKACERLIRKAAQMCSGNLHVIHVSREGWSFFNKKNEGEALQYLFEISKSAGAELTVLKSDDTAGAIIRYAKDNSIECLVLGQSPSEKSRNNLKTSLMRRAGDVEIMVIPQF